MGDPDIVAEQPAGTNLVDGAASVHFGAVLAGASANRNFTIKNVGSSDLTGLSISFIGTAAADFVVTTSLTNPVVGGGSTTFNVRFAPTTAGAKTATLQLFSNDSDENPFDIALTGGVVSPGVDDDGDGITNQGGGQLASLGFDPLVDNTALRTLLQNNAAGLGLYRASDMQTLALGSPVLERDVSTGHFHLSIDVQKSPSLSTWTPLTGFTPTYDVFTGRIDLEIISDTSNAQFYRVLGGKP